MVHLLSSDASKLFAKIVREGRVQGYLRALSEHHQETTIHSLRVCVLALDIAYDVQPDSNHTTLGYAALLHDIGKMRVPLEILAKQSGLLPQERVVMNAHPRFGFLELKDEVDLIRRVVVAHHEYKNEPYPRKGTDRRLLTLQGQSRPADDRREHEPFVTQAAQLIAVADMYDALAHQRSYKKPIPKEEIPEILARQYRGERCYLDALLRRI